MARIAERSSSRKGKHLNYGLAMSQTADDHDSLRARIFPPWPPRDGLLMRTARVGSWESQFVGAGRLTAFVSDHLLRFGAALDDIGLGVVFLQHHRVELGLKLALERAGVADIPNDHRIGVLVVQCERAMESAGLAEEWQRLEGDHGPFLELLNDVDPRSFAFRYPVDTRREVVSRPPLVDLVELEAEGARFHRSVERLVDLLACREGLRLTMAEAVASSSEIADAIRAINTAHAAVELIDASLASTGRRLGAARGELTARMAEVRAKANAQTAIMHALKRPLARTLAVLESQLGDRAATPNLEPDSVAEFASQTAPDAAGLRRHLDEQVEWTGRTFAEQLRNVGEALGSVYERSASWPGIATMQLHSDLGRFLARLYVNFPAEDAPRKNAGASETTS